MESKEQIALANLYNASRLANLSADHHEQLRQCAEFLREKLTPAPEAAPAEAPEGGQE
jgi:hypothetical protein